MKIWNPGVDCKMNFSPSSHGLCQLLHYCWRKLSRTPQFNLVCKPLSCILEIADAQGCRRREAALSEIMLSKFSGRAVHESDFIKLWENLNKSVTLAFLKDNPGGFSLRRRRTQILCNTCNTHFKLQESSEEMKDQNHVYPAFLTDRFPKPKEKLDSVRNESLCNFEIISNFN